MKGPFVQMWNTHVDACGVPPEITNEANEGFYYGYFENRFGEQWVFIYDRKEKVGELRGGDIGWKVSFPCATALPT